MRRFLLLLLQGWMVAFAIAAINSSNRGEAVWENSIISPFFEYTWPGVVGHFIGVSLVAFVVGWLLSNVTGIGRKKV